MWHVSSRSGVATLRTAIHLLLVTYPESQTLDNLRINRKIFSKLGLALQLQPLQHT